MNLVKNIVLDIGKRPSLYFFVFLIIFTIDRHHRYEGGIDQTGTFNYDVAEYYSYLPDLLSNDQAVAEQHIRTNKRTIGMAIMYGPSFMVGHLLAKWEGVAQDGYSQPYQWAIRWGSIIYAILGLFFCRRSLLLLFNETITLLSLVSVFFGTNLLFYTYTWGEMPHSYLFFLYAVFIYLTLVLIRDEKQKLLLWIFFIGGFITLIRPTGIVVFLFPLLYKVSSLHDLKTRFYFLFSKPFVLALAVVLFWIPLLIQMMIWKKYNGHFVYYSYGDQSFFFNDPKMIKFLIGMRKGWLVYTPIMAFSLIGMALSFKCAKDFFIFHIIYFPLVVYILSSWWDWSSGGSFGCRVLIESYAFFIFPMALFIKSVWQFITDRRIINISVRALLVVMIYFFIKINIIQLDQCKYGLLHWNGCDKELYKFLFLKEEFSKEDIEHVRYLHSRFIQPDVEEMKKGNRDI